MGHARVDTTLIAYTQTVPRAHMAAVSKTVWVLEA